MRQEHRRYFLVATVCTGLFLHAALIARSAWRHSPTVDEPAHLAAGISYWELQRFDSYRVNPPLVRLAAAAPCLFAGPKLDWRSYNPSPGSRSEFSVGHDFVRVNGARSFWLMTLARWACIPFSLLGAIVCFLWARELWGRLAGLLALALWCFSPNVLAYGALITSDVAAAALAVSSAYVFWRWLKQPGWPWALLAGAVLGLALLTKFTNVLLVGLLPLIWLLSKKKVSGPFFQASAIPLVALAVLNLGYGFEGVF